MIQKFLSAHRKWLMIIGGFLFIFFMFLIIAGPAIVEPAVRKRLHAMVIDGSDSLYNYQLQDLSVQIIGGKITLDQFRLFVDSSRYEQLQLADDLPSTIMELDLVKGEIKGLSLLSFLFNKRVKIAAIISQKGSITMTRLLSGSNKKTTKPPFWKKIQPGINSIVVDQVKLDGINLRYISRDTTGPLNLNFDQLFAQLDQIKIDSTSAADTTRLFYAKEIAVKLEEFNYRTADSNYVLSAKVIDYSSGKKMLEVEDLHFRPYLEKEAHYAKTGLEETLYFLKAPALTIRGLHAETFVHLDKLDIDSILVKDPEVRVYHDRTQERNFKTKVGNYPHQLVLGASVPLHIRAIGLQNAAITYTEKSDITGLEGEVKVRDLQLYFTNLTNKPALIQKDPVMKAEGKGNILGSPITALFNFHLDSSNGQFNVKGQVGNMKGAQLNVISVPLAQIQINSLQIHKVDFAITADDNNGYCNLDMTYNDFSITIKEISRDEGTRESRGFISKAVNRFIVYNHNPLNGNTRVARGAKFMRLNDQSFFGMVWRSIFAGMQEIMLSSGSL